MWLALRFVVLLLMASALGFAGIWQGALVDSKCYSAMERNMNPTDTTTYVDRDLRHEILYCSPSSKTRFFGVVQRDGVSFAFDSAGNQKAAELIRVNGKRSIFVVAIVGEIANKVIQVDSILAAK